MSPISNARKQSAQGSRSTRLDAPMVQKTFSYVSRSIQKMDEEELKITRKL